MGFCFSFNSVHASIYFGRYSSDGFLFVRYFLFKSKINSIIFHHRLCDEHLYQNIFECSLSFVYKTYVNNILLESVHISLLCVSVCLFVCVCVQLWVLKWTFELYFVVFLSQFSVVQFYHFNFRNKRVTDIFFIESLKWIFFILHVISFMYVHIKDFFKCLQ